MQNNEINGNLSKTKPKLRTEGAVTGNFGAGRRKGGSYLAAIPTSNKETLGNFPSQSEYLNRMKEALTKTTDPALQKFILSEIAKIEQGRREMRDTSKPQGSYCDLKDHHVKPHQ